MLRNLHRDGQTIRFYSTLPAGDDAYWGAQRLLLKYGKGGFQGRDYTIEGSGSEIRITFTDGSRADPFYRFLVAEEARAREREAAARGTEAKRAEGVTNG